MRAVIVTGDRHADWKVWGGIIDRAFGNDPVFVIHGNADGIDTIAKSQTYETFQRDEVGLPAQWKKHGKPAGSRRNTAMLTILKILEEHGYTIAVLAFHDVIAESKGTKDMINQAIRAGVETWLYTTYNDPKRITEVLAA